MGSEIIIAASLVILLFSVIIHEVAHGWVARMYGDRTAENAGRLTLNPLPHIDPIGTILVPLGLFFLSVTSGAQLPIFGWAKPVPVNPLHFRNIRQGELFVSLAGIGANLGLVLAATVIYHLAGLFAGTDLIQALMAATVLINLSLAIFNLIPIPPLDGSKALMAVLPYELAVQYQKLERYGFILLFVLMFLPPTRAIFTFILTYGVDQLMSWLL